MGMLKRFASLETTKLRFSFLLFFSLGPAWVGADATSQWNKAAEGPPCFTVDSVFKPQCVGCEGPHNPSGLISVTSLVQRSSNSARPGLMKEDNCTIQWLWFNHLYWINCKLEERMEQTYREMPGTSLASRHLRISLWKVCVCNSLLLGSVTNLNQVLLKISLDDCYDYQQKSPSTSQWKRLGLPLLPWHTSSSETSRWPQTE